MNYSAAITAVNAGQYAWRISWVQGWYLHKVGTEIYIYKNLPGTPYSPSSDDESAIDWDSGDHPPHGK